MTTETPGFGTTLLGDTFVDDKGGGARVVLPETGYVFGDVIGRGGMGEVVRVDDKRIGRQVALKRMRGEHPSATAITRFLREARIQARLDHPAIVPVYELGVDDGGRPFFTMKRLTGVTLAEKLAQRAPVKSLLRTFIDVCLAIEFAHARGVIHRDLKPSNIMLGDYGEVYVLDWGVARVRSDGDRPTASNDDIESLEEGTRTGDLLGTPGYMSPEQVRGQDVQPPSDVYALGTMLFEILAGEPLHPRGTAALASTLTAPQQAPVQRRSDVPPELDAACTDALVEDPLARPTARELAERVQRYLDGDRDLEARRTLVAAHLVRARTALASGDPERRAEAMQAAGQALALDQASGEAAQLVSGLIVEPPAKLPSELVRVLAEEERRVGVERLKRASWTLCSVFLLLLFAPWLGIRSWLAVGEFYGTIGAVGAVMWSLARARRNWVGVNLLVVLVLAIAFSRVLGPWIVTPIVILGGAFAVSANEWLDRRPLVLVGWVALCLLAPVGLEAAGILGETYHVGTEGVISVSRLLVGDSKMDAVALVTAHLVLLAAISLFAGKVNHSARLLRREVRIQAWHLGQLLPATGLGV